MTMEPEDEPLEIEVTEGDAGTEAAEPEIIVEKAEEKTPEVPVDTGLEALKKQLEDERKARFEAERRAHEASQTAYQYHNEAQDTNLHLVINAIETVRQNNSILKSNYAHAMANNDFETAADIQSEMSQNSAKLLQLEQGRQALEAAPKQEAPQPYVSDPVEALASQLSPRSADWVRRHPEYATDARLYQKMIAAHQLAVADGLDPDTSDYFHSIESTLRINSRGRDDDYDAMADSAKPTQRRSAPPAAPVSRSGTGTSSRPNRVTLSPQEREMASMMGMTPEEYGRNKLALQKEGKLN